MSQVTGKRGTPTKGGSCGTSETASVRTQPRRRGGHWGRQGRGLRGQPCVVTGPGSPARPVGCRGGGDWSAEPCDEPGAECGRQTASVNRIRVRRADLLSAGPSGERERGILVSFPAQEGAVCLSPSGTSVPRAGPWPPGCPVLVPRCGVRCHPTTAPAGLPGVPHFGGQGLREPEEAWAWGKCVLVTFNGNGGFFGGKQPDSPLPGHKDSVCACVCTCV